MSCPLIPIVSIVIEYFIVIASFEDEEVDVTHEDLSHLIDAYVYIQLIY